MANVVQALVTAPIHINGVLHLPGEVAYADLEQLGVDEIGDKTPGLAPLPEDGAPLIEQVEVAPFAAHVPTADVAQQIPPGTRTSGSGRLLSPDDSNTIAREMAPARVTKAKDAPVAAGQPE